MHSLRLLLCLLIALAMPVQAIAAAAPRLACLHGGSDSAASANMDCHGDPASDPAAPPCCGDACPDMAVCAATPAVNATALLPSVTGPVAAPPVLYLIPTPDARLSNPFRPPAISRA
jgi:hypothetical protein